MFSTLVPVVRPEIFDLRVRKLDPTIDVGEITVLSPAANFFLIATRAAIAIRPPAVGLLEEALILALEVVLEHHTLHARPFPRRALGGCDIRAIHLRVVHQLTSTDDSGVEGLPGLLIARAVRLEQFAPLRRQCDEIASGFTIDGGDVSQQAVGLEMCQVAVMEVARTAAVIAKVVDRHHAEGPHGGQGPYLRATEPVCLAAQFNRLALAASR